MPFKITQHHNNKPSVKELTTNSFQEALGLIPKEYTVHLKPNSTDTDYFQVVGPQPYQIARFGKLDVQENVLPIIPTHKPLIIKSKKK